MFSTMRAPTPRIGSPSGGSSAAVGAAAAGSGAGAGWPAIAGRSDAARRAVGGDGCGRRRLPAPTVPIGR